MARSIQADGAKLKLNVTPHSIEAEQSVIGGLMLDNSVWDAVVDTGIKPSDFYRRDHQLLFTGIAQLAERHIPFDLVTLGEQLERSGHLEQAGGMAYLGELASNIPSVANIRAYAQIIRERAQLRHVVEACASGMELAYRPEGKSAAEVLDEIERQLFALNEAVSFNDASDIPTALGRVLDDIDRCHESGQAFTGLDTGLRDLNALTGGLQPSNLIVLGARPSMGKTSLALQLAWAALDHQENTDTPSVQIYSMEMPCDDIIRRLLAQKGQLNATKLKNGQLRDEDWQRLLVAAQAIKTTHPRLALDDSGSLTPTLLRAKVRRNAKRFGLPKLIIVDYLQLMNSGDSKKPENRNLEIASITRSLKALSLEMRCPVVLLSQLNRSPEGRRPHMANLRDSGAIEQDADLVLLLYRDEVSPDNLDNQGIAEIIVGKNRNGQTGTVKVAWIAEQTRFADLAHYPYEGA